jgi:hypothetical protein
MVDDIRTNKRSSKVVPDTVDEDPEEPTFTPPEVMADEEEVIDMAELESAREKSGKGKGDKKGVDTHDKKQPSKLKSKLKDLVTDSKLWWKDRSKKQKIIIGAAAAVAVILLFVGGFLLIQRHKPAPKAAPVVAKKEEVKEPPKPTTEASHLTGIQVPPEYNLLPVTGIIIENSPDARPQSGLTEAGVVFEAIAEGGITRFLTLFQEAQPDYVGPVRSVRPYYLQWLQGFDAAVAHVGGSPEALAKIRNEGIKDLDQSFNGGSYQRIAVRYAPHNVYTSLGSLIALGKSKGFTSSSFTGFARKNDKPVATPTARSIDIIISGPLYNVHYSYDAATNSYQRSQAGILHKDERSGKQISPKVVIALIVPQGISPDGVHTSYGIIGSGMAYFFQDGTVTQGTWSKSSDKEQLRFGDANGSPLAINAGQTWITAVGAATSVVSTP